MTLAPGMTCWATMPVVGVSSPRAAPPPVRDLCIAPRTGGAIQAKSGRRGHLPAIFTGQMQRVADAV